jgi:hypothetical protein
LERNIYKYNIYNIYIINGCNGGVGKNRGNLEGQKSWREREFEGEGGDWWMSGKASGIQGRMKHGNGEGTRDVDEGE